MTQSEEFERLAAPLRTELVAYCYRVVGSADEAEDLAQETYLRAWRSYGTLEGRSSLRAGLRLALIAALQYLPARKRAVLILRDVLDWPAADTARMLDMSTTAVNSALRRARSRLDAVLPDAEEITEPPGRRQRDLASRYATAFQEADLATLVSLLRADVIAEMPPLPGWFVGAAQVSQFFATHVLSGSARFALFPIEANGQLAFATYASQPDGTWEAHAIHVLEISGGQIARVAAFLEPGLFAGFGLRRTLTAPTTTRAAALTGGTA